MSTLGKALILFLLSLAVSACQPGTTQSAPKVAQSAPRVLPPVPMDVLGITIGEPLKIPRCSKREDFHTKATCWRENYGDQQQSRVVPMNAALDVYFAESDVPTAIFSAATVVIEDGKVLDVSLVTMDISQEEIYKMLQDKWGKPIEANVANLQNGFGAHFQSIEAHWVFPKLRILFLGKSTSDTGSITFQSLPRPADLGPKQPTTL